MKKIVLIFTCLVGLATATFAQSKEDVDAQRKKSLDQATSALKEIGSDEKQIAKMKEIMEALFKKQDEIKADAVLTPEEKKEKLKAANGEKDWKVQKLLGDKIKAYGEARKRLNEAAKAQ